MDNVLYFVNIIYILKMINLILVKNNVRNIIIMLQYNKNNINVSINVLLNLNLNSVMTNIVNQSVLTLIIIN